MNQALENRKHRQSQIDKRMEALYGLSWKSLPVEPDAPVGQGMWVSPGKYRIPSGSGGSSVANLTKPTWRFNYGDPGAGSFWSDFLPGLMTVGLPLLGAMGGLDFLSSMNPFTQSGGQFGNLAGGSFAGDPIGAMGYTASASDPIEALWRASEATGETGATGAAAQMGFSSPEGMLNLADPAWADSSLLSQGKQAYDQYGKPAKQAYDLIKMFQEPVLKGGQQQVQQQTTSAGASSSGTGGTQGFSFLPQAGQTTALPGTSDVAGTKGPGQAVYTGPGAPPVSNTGDTRNALGLLGVDTY